MERYALKFMENYEECWSAEQLRAAEAQIEEQKRAWELKRLATLAENDDENGLLADPTCGPAEIEAGLLTFSQQDAANQVKRKPAKTRTNKSSNISNQSVASSPEPSGAVARRRRRNHTRDLSDNTNESVSSSKEVVSKTVLEPSSSLSGTPDSSLCVTPENSRRKRTRKSLRSQSATPEVSQDESASQASNNGKTLSPRTRSRGSVNINLWTLDVKPLPGAKALPSPRSASGRVKDGCSPLPATDAVVSNGCDSEGGGGVASKRVKRAIATDGDAEPDLDVVS